MNGSPDTSRLAETPAVLDDLPPGIAWLLGPGRRAPALEGAAGVAEPAVRAQVVTWLPEGRWVTDPDELAPDCADKSDASGRRRGRSGDSERGRPWPGQGHPGHDRLGPAQFRPARELGAGQSHPPPTEPEPDQLMARGEADAGQPQSRKGGLDAGRVRRSGGELAAGERRTAMAERARRRGERRVRLARVGARLAGWPRRVIIGVLLVLAAVLALRPDAAQPPAAAVGPTQHVVVAARDLAAGTELAATDLRVVAMPVGIVPLGSSPRAAGLIGRIAAGAIRRGEALTDARVVGPGLAAGLEAGESAAVPVRIADPDAAALVRVGDRVDVLGAPVAPDGTQAAAGETVTVASAVRVLAVLRSRDPADGVLLVVATGAAAAQTLAGAAARHRLTVNVRPP